jgi:hypothetical protein
MPWVKMKIGRDVKADLARVSAARKAIGPETGLFPACSVPNFFATRNIFTITSGSKKCCLMALLAR